MILTGGTGAVRSEVLRLLSQAGVSARALTRPPVCRSPTRMMEASWGPEPFQPLAHSLAGGLAQIAGPTASRGATKPRTSAQAFPTCFNDIH